VQGQVKGHGAVVGGRRRQMTCRRMKCGRVLADGVQTAAELTPGEGEGGGGLADDKVRA
jgi:hypothetical protein